MNNNGQGRVSRFFKPERSRDAAEMKFKFERELLGTMLRTPACIDDVLGIVDSSAMFGFDAHRLIFAVVADLHTTARPVEMATLAEELARRGDLNNVKYDYISTVWNDAGMPANIAHYARMVRGQHLLRSLRQIAKDIHYDASRPVSEADDILAQAERRLHDITAGTVSSDAVSLKQLMAEVSVKLDRRAAEGGSGMPVGLCDLDAKLNGWHDSELVLLAGRPGTGKTALALEFMQRLCLRGFPVLFISLEQARGELGERLLSRVSYINSQHLRTGRIARSDQDALVHALNRVAEADGYIDDVVPQTVLRIGALARRYVRKHGVRMVIVDYLQLVSPSDKRLPRHEQVAEMSRGFKLLARDLKVPVLALTQLNRQSEGRAGNRPALADLRESGAQEQDADTVLLLHRPFRGDVAQDNAIEVIIAKQRNGPEGVVTLAYRKECFGFDNFAVDQF